MMMNWRDSCRIIKVRVFLYPELFLIYQNLPIYYRPFIIGPYILATVSTFYETTNWRNVNIIICRWNLMGESPPFVLFSMTSCIRTTVKTRGKVKSNQEVKTATLVLWDFRVNRRWQFPPCMVPVMFRFASVLTLGTLSWHAPNPRAQYQLPWVLIGHLFHPGMRAMLLTHFPTKLSLACA